MPAIYGFDDVGNHANMLLDHVRTDAYRAAIVRAVGPDDVVCDVGSGTGLLALWAAQAGARHVYAIERGPMAELIEVAVRDNGFVGRITTLRADARTIELPQTPTLIISETLGSMGIDEDIVGLLGALHRRYPQARLMPEALTVHAALAQLPELDGELHYLAGEGDAGLNLNLSAFAKRLWSRPAVAPVASSTLLTEPAALSSITLGEDVVLSPLNTTLHADSKGVANAVVAWFSARLCDGVLLTSSPMTPSPSWAHLVLPLAPALALAPSATVSLELRPRVVTQRATWSWSVAVGDEVRRGDAMNSLAGGLLDVRAALARPQGVDDNNRNELGYWRAALGAERLEPGAMAEALCAAYPSHFAGPNDAAQVVTRLLAAARITL